MKHTTPRASNDLSLLSVQAPSQPSTSILRKALIGLLIFMCICAISLLIAPKLAYAVTQSQIDAAQAESDAIEEKLDAIVSEYEAMSKKQASTIDKIESIEASIKANEKRIEECKQRLIELHDDIADLAVRTYKSEGLSGFDIVDMLLSAGSLKDVMNTISYIERINSQKMKLIDEVTALTAEIEAKQIQLKEERESLVTLKEEQQVQLDQMKEKQKEVQKLFDEANAEVKKLQQQRNAELWAAAQASNKSGSATSFTVTGSGSQAAVLRACQTTPSPGMNWCAAWVTNVFRNAGIGTFWGDACDMYSRWCTSSDRSALQPGMIVAVSTYNKNAAGRMYGHIGIYIGNNKVMENIGSIAITNLDSWISYYGTTVTPRWGWLGGVKLS